MKQLFHLDSKFMQALSTLGDYILLNLLFLIFCVPVVTIGAAKSAMYRAMFEMLEDNGALYKKFCKTFFHDFFPAMVMFLLKYVVVVALLWMLMITASNAIPLRKVILFAQGLFLLAWLMVFSNVFAQISRFKSTFSQYLHNALYIALTHPLKSLLTAVMDVAPIALFLIDPGLMALLFPLWMFLYFSVTGNLSAKIWKKPFDYYISASQEEEN